MPIAPAVLRPWRPGIADIDDWRDTPNPEPVRPGTLVMAADVETQDQQCLWRAAERAGIAGRLFEADTRLKGYDWYNALARADRPCASTSPRPASPIRWMRCGAGRRAERRHPPPRRACRARSPGPTPFKCTLILY